MKYWSHERKEFPNPIQIKNVRILPERTIFGKIFLFFWNCLNFLKKNTEQKIDQCECGGNGQLFHSGCYGATDLYFIKCQKCGKESQVTSNPWKAWEFWNCK